MHVQFFNTIAVANSEIKRCNFWQF